MNAINAKPTPAERLERYLHDNIPLVQHMQIQVASHDERGLTLTAPLAANINHSRTAFGGSLAALATLACWGELWLLLDPQPGLHIVVHESHIRYLHPVTDTLIARCKPPELRLRNRFVDTLQKHHKARLKVSSEIVLGETVCVEFTGTFVAFHDDAG